MGEVALVLAVLSVFAYYLNKHDNDDDDPPL